MMATEANKALARRFGEEFWSSGQMATADELIAPGATISVNDREVMDIDTLKATARAWREAFPDWRSPCDELVAEGDRVTEHWTGRGTHRGEYRGIPATGRQVIMRGAAFYRIVGGKIVELRTQSDRMALIEQLGITVP
jgi:steroid delta-isomerase-like uncharacterized protein